VRETERDDFIDTADLILNKEIEIIKKLTKLKERKIQEIEEIVTKTQEERIKLRRAEELRPKIHRKIQKENEISRYESLFIFSETKSYIDDIIFLIQKEQMAKTEFEQEYITPMLGTSIL
jgi:tyrosyl-tRNA synthetase